jgi:beta-phosphoglucomutase-like phosphatase (HAD superfamily)
VSSGNPDHLAQAQRMLGLTGVDQVDAVTTGGDVESSKPVGELFQQALDRAGGQRALVIGDSPWDGVLA